MAYKALEGQAPAYLSQSIVRYEPTRSLSQVLLVAPKIRTQKYGARTFGYGAPTILNSFPLTVWQAPTIDTFKSKLKMHYLN